MAAPFLDLTHCCRPCLRRLFSHSKTHTLSHSRPFTSSPARRKHGDPFSPPSTHPQHQQSFNPTNSNPPGPLPTFAPTPSDELNALLSTIRSNIFLPSHLIKLQHKLLYRKKDHALLTSDEPATVRLGDEVHQLLPLDHQKDEPSTARSLSTIIALMTSTRDFQNLPPLLSGLKIARRSVKTPQIEKMVRRACDNGRQGVVHDCLRQVESTGIGLWEVRVAREVMWGATLKAIQADWSEEGVERGVKFAEDVWELCFDPRHTERMRGVEDAKKRPEILGVLVQMHAAKAVMYGGGKDEEGLVSRYTKMMLKLWGNAEAELVVSEEDFYDANYKLVMWAPVWHGMTMAKKVLGPDSPLGRQLGERLSQDIEPLVQAAVAILQANPPQGGGKRRGLKLYEDMSSLQASR